ncbi:MAG: ankyrin repeat domain-containing protein [Candidatus Symbiothrix sp.]|nr:ankyrin repeat domain-containing protein [Candidatus Symbiothrix sp.]
MKTTQILLLSVASLLMLSGCSNKKGSENTAGEEEECHDEFIKTIDYGGAPYRFTELGLACHDGDLSKVQTLIQNGACTTGCMGDDIFEYDALYTAVWFGKPDIVNYLIRQGENVNRIYGEARGTLLSLACLNEDKEIAFKMAELLIKAGASVQAEQNFDGGYTAVPLHFAVGKNNLSLVKLLIEHGADIHIESEGMTIFQMADMSANAEMKEYIQSLH